MNYRIAPYTMRESATDLQRAIRYVRAHAADYRIAPENIALVGFSAGGILNGEVLLNWRDLGGRKREPSDTASGIYIVKGAGGSRKILR